MSQKEANKQTDSVSFYQIITVIAILIIAVIIKATNKDFYEILRLKYVNIIGDRGGYNEIVYPANAKEEDARFSSDTSELGLLSVCGVNVDF